MVIPTALIRKRRRSAGVERQEGFWRRVYTHFWERRRVALLECELDQPPVARPARVPVRFSWAGPEEVACLVRPELNFGDETLREARRWLDEGDQCLIGYVDDAPATYWWITFTVRRLPGRRLRIGGRHAYLYKSFTAERLRRHGLNQAALSVALAHCHGLGIRRAFVDADVRNAGSLGSLRNAGFKDIGTFTIIRLGRQRRTFVERRLRQRVAAGVTV